MGRDSYDDSLERYMLAMTGETKEKLLEEYDRYGDSYTKDITATDLREVLHP